MRLSIVIPTVNRADLLSDLIKSLLKQTGHFEEAIVIDNGQQALDYSSPKITLLNQSRNLGVAASWNLGINILRRKNIEWALILNDDIVLNENQISKIKNKLKTQENILICSFYGLHVFALNLRLVYLMEYSQDKYFDENFYPAYCEDTDFFYRAYLKKIPVNHVIKELSPEVYIISMSIIKNQDLNSNFGKNIQYYTDKWGGSPGNERFSKPFDRVSSSIDIISVAYQRSPEIKTFINSIKAQSFRNYKLHLFHDGPEFTIKDELERENYLNSDILFHYCDKTYGTYGHHLRDIGIRYFAESPWLLITNADNYYCPTFLEEMLCHSHNMDVVFCEMVHSHLNYQLQNTSFANTGIDIGAFIVRTEIAKKINFNHRDFGADGKFIDEIKQAYPDLRVKKVEKILFVHN